MKKTDICELCTEYSTNNQCDNESDCRMVALWNENNALKNKVSDLKKELDDAKLKMSYMVNPNAIGNRNDMGW